ncbi:hypothetical protein GLF_1091 [Gluconobacter frateurii NBRC 101659]|nr:hypothetical protein GLF_1091 [Gluconobacter frateurii NBRC 101659]
MLVDFRCHALLIIGGNRVAKLIGMVCCHIAHIDASACGRIGIEHHGDIALHAIGHGVRRQQVHHLPSGCGISLMGDEAVAGQRVFFMKDRPVRRTG